jgi:hypothetical protein
MPDGVWKPASDALQIGKHAIPTFAAQPIKRIGKEGIIVYELNSTINHRNSFRQAQPIGAAAVKFYQKAFQAIQRSRYRRRRLAAVLNEINSK